MNVHFLNTIQSGLDLYELVRGDVPVSGFIGLTPDRDVSGISGFASAEATCRRDGLAYHTVRDYALRDPADRALLESLEIDVLVVSGWQRLIPDWLIEHCRIAALGIHGSPFGITRGRGRSPLNWALLMGMDSFEIALFRIDTGVDSGAVLMEERFSLTPSDDIRTAYLKAATTTASMLRRLFREGRIGDAGRSQNESDAEYLPQRRPEDGAIDWRRTASEIVDFVRALARPYPGAFSEVDGGRLAIWRAVPFPDATFAADAAPGTVVAAFSGGELLVRCGDGCRIVLDHESSSDARSLVGTTLRSADFHAQMEEIRQRHRGGPISSRLARRE